MIMEVKRILLVEDSPKDIELMLTALKECNLGNEVDVAQDGQEALDYLNRVSPYDKRPEGNPAVVLLDLKLPKVDGFEVLRRIRNDNRLKRIPVVILTSSFENRDVLASYELGVNAYVVKPLDFEQFFAAIKKLGVFWAVINQPPSMSVS